jgi:hypothetical protein
MAGILITDGGPHSAEKWAVATSERIFDITKVAGERVIAAKKLQNVIAESMVRHHAEAQAREQTHLAVPETAAARKNLEYTVDRDEALRETAEVIADVQKAAAGTPWAAHWADPEVIKAATQIISSDLMTVKDIERRWHTDRNS